MSDTQRLQTKLEERLIDIMDTPEYRDAFTRPALAKMFRAGYTAGAGMTLRIMREDGWQEPPPWKRRAD